MGDENKKSINIELLENNKKLEFSSVEDADLMRIKCFATHEGVNLNNTEFTREVLLEAYPSFIDKPLFIVPNDAGEPTGHGFDFVKKEFDTDKRKVVGHIADAFPCMVNNGNTTMCSGMQDDEIMNAQGEMRIVCTCIVYKNYLAEVADMLERFHTEGNLNFSMEGIVDCCTDADGVRHCSNIQFTGLTIVKNPAFQHSKSVAVAEKKDEGGNDKDMDEKLKALQAKYDALLAKYNALKNEKGGAKEKPEAKPAPVDKKKKACAEVNIDKFTEVLEELASLKVEVAELKPYKEKVDSDKANALGEKRHKRLQSLGYTEKSVEELAKMSQEEYVTLLEQVMDKNDKAKAAKGGNKEVAEDIQGVLQYSPNVKNEKDELLEILSSFEV
ncbi:MAG: hypothetical protein M0P10_06500 [Sphaerochaetaceae bacterium]|nr:hypothetical protein [Sphaerochaetaceae bacterium]